jgi:tetratricopeptide (TPR) repeat protein
VAIQGYFTYGSEHKKKQALYQKSLMVLDDLEEPGQDVRYEKAGVMNFMGELTSISDFDESLGWFKQSLNRFENLGDLYGASEALIGLGRTCFLWGRMENAEKYLQESLVNFRKLGDSRRTAHVLLWITWFFMRQGSYEEAKKTALERLEIYELIGDPSAIADGQADLAVCYGSAGEFKKEAALLKKAMAVHQEMAYYTEFFEDARHLCANMLDRGKYQQAYELASYALDWTADRFSTISERVKGETEMRRIGITYSNQGRALIALGKITEAERLLEQSRKVLKEVFPATATVYHHALLAVVCLKLNKPAKEHVINGLRKGLALSSSIAQLLALSATALLFADQGKYERAVEIYALARQNSMIAKSQWYQDVIETPITNMTASLPPEVIAAAQQRGQERDREATVEELLAEFG